MDKQQRKQKQLRVRQQQKRNLENKVREQPDEFDRPPLNVEGKGRSMPNAGAKRNPNTLANRLSTPTKIGGTIALAVGLLICLATGFVPTDFYPESLKPLTDMKKETAGISVASMVVALIILRSSSESRDLFSQMWHWSIAIAGYVASILAFEDEHWLGLLVHMSTTAPVVIAIMVTTFPQKPASIPLWLLVWSAAGLVGIALLDSTVYGMALYHTIGADIYLGVGALLIAIFSSLYCGTWP